MLIFVSSFYFALQSYAFIINLQEYLPIFFAK